MPTSPLRRAVASLSLVLWVACDQPDRGHQGPLDGEGFVVLADGDEFYLFEKVPLRGDCAEVGTGFSAQFEVEPPGGEPHRLEGEAELSFSSLGEHRISLICE